MAKKQTKTAAPVSADNQPQTTAPAVAKVKKTKVEVPLTPAQLEAKAALAKADADARLQLIEASKGKLEGAEKVVAEAKAAFDAAKAALKALRKTVGIKGTFGGKKIATFFYVQDFPEGKGAPQARAILEIVKAGGAKGVARDQVVETMKTAIDTKMDRSRLLSYYASRMVEAGVIRGE